MNEEIILTKAGLQDLAQELASEIKPADNIFLTGELGSGKTTFTQQLLKALGSNEIATSPTFQIMNEYPLKNEQRLMHFDLYRLEHPDDVAALGIHDYLRDPKAIVIIEWPEKGEQVLPEPDWHLHFEHRSPTTRQLQVTKK